MTWIPAIALLGLVVAYDYWVLRPGPRARIAALAALPALAASAALPLLVPGTSAVRSLACGLAIILAVKSWELSRQRAADPAMVRTWPRFLLWLFIPPDTHWSETADERAHARRHGRRRLARAFAKAPLIYGLLAVATRWPELHDAWLTATFWAMWMTYLCLSGLADAATGLAMQSGVWAREVFVWPVFARSPRDYWGKRWNLFIATFAFRHLFIPLGGRRRPVRATFAVFLTSGIMHEYLVAASLRHASQHTGAMMVFFSVQALAVILESILGRRSARRKRLPRPVAIGLHLTWLVCTVPIFLAPLNEVLYFTSWRLP